MSNFKHVSCPICGNSEIETVKPSVGDSFAFLEIDSKTKTHTLNSGFKVQLIKCGDCNMVFMVNPEPVQN